MSSPAEYHTLAADRPLAQTRGAERYTATAIALHWIVGLAVIGMVALGIWMINLPKAAGTFRADMYNLHKSIGMTLGLLILARLAWRYTHPVPLLPPGTLRWQALASDFTHHALYLCLVVQPLTGFLGSLSSPFPVKYFGHTLPFGSWDIAWAKELLGTVHLANATLLSALILVHLGAVLHHLLVRRDGVFQRMWFERGR